MSILKVGALYNVRSDRYFTRGADKAFIGEYSFLKETTWNPTTWVVLELAGMYCNTNAEVYKVLQGEDVFFIHVVREERDLVLKEIQ